ncbi:MAG: hypothetical protein FWF02_09895, partial [Micrococcales bacterium]|nr:hypothetical protein [Micrococcales bacterium]
MNAVAVEFSQSSGRFWSRATALAAARTELGSLIAASTSTVRRRWSWRAAIAAPPTTRIEAAHTLCGQSVAECVKSGPQLGGVQLAAGVHAVTRSAAETKTFR